MKSSLLFLSLILLFWGISSCKKETVELPPDNEIPDPADTTTQRSFRIIFQNMAGTGLSPENATVLMSFDHAAGSTIHMSAPMIFDKNYSTSQLKLPKGSYQLKKMVIMEGTAARFAIPVKGSVKAPLVAKPLSLPVLLEEQTEKEIRVEILNVMNSDIPENFGYPEGTFGTRTSEPEQEMDKRIFIRTMIKVGEVRYDSIPVQLIVKSWDAKNEMSYNVHYLAAGAQGIYLQAKAERHQLSISKWGITDEITLTKAEIEEDKIYEMGGEKEAKKPKTVYESKIVEGKSTPLTKTDFEYHPNGQLKQKQMQAKRPDGSTYLSQKDLFEYTDGRITAIRSYDEHGMLFKTLTAEYDNEGRAQLIVEKKGTALVNARIYYIPLETRSGLRQDYRVDVVYSYEHDHFQRYLVKTMSGLSPIADRTTGNGNLEEGLYEYDAGINPYVHLSIPDVTMSQLDGHNMKTQWKIWSGAHPENVATTFQYQYDADGYPTEVLTQYNEYKTKKEVYAIRTVFLY